MKAIIFEGADKREVLMKIKAAALEIEEKNPSEYKKELKVRGKMPG
jgi:hypothetical protein